MSNWFSIGARMCKAQEMNDMEAIKRLSKEAEALCELELMEKEAKSEALTPENPRHYKGDLVEHWDLAIERGWGYFLSACTKYLWRWRKKNGLEDLRKARTYLDKYIKYLENNPQLLENISIATQDPI